MNINFHYFAVKTIALKAGIPEQEAQMLASYSQLVDDFDIFSPIYLDRVPIFAQHLAEKVTTNKWRFYPVTTGFDDISKMARLIFEKNQRLITIPFHFVTKKSLNRYPKDTPRQNYRTVPTHLNDGSLMSSMLNDACARYKIQSNIKNLMHIGMLLHTFADTYAHQNFSGFWGWENDSKVTRVIDNNSSGNDLTPKYKKSLPKRILEWIQKLLKRSMYKIIPSIGHADVSTAPDDSFVSFNIKLKNSENDNYSFHYNRNNTKEFDLAAKQIYNYLCDCFAITNMNDKEWNNFINRLNKGFLLTENEYKDVATLCRKWQALFPSYNYSYSKGTFVESALVPVTNNSYMPDMSLVSEVLHNPNSLYKENLFKVIDEKFFMYNVIANEIRDKVNNYNEIVNKTEFKAVYEAFMASEKEK